MPERKKKSEEEWRRSLGDEEYHVLRKKGTETPYTGRYWNETKEGVYRCRGCGTVLFSSDAKYDAGCGWPSFHEAAIEGNINTEIDRSHFMVRTEVLCAACDGHLGHVFPDGPQPTGMRYCINSASLDLDDGVSRQRDRDEADDGDG